MSDSMTDDVKERWWAWAVKKILATAKMSEREAKKIKHRIWLDTCRTCEKPITRIELEDLFKQNISDWCSEYKKK